MANILCFLYKDRFLGDSDLSWRDIPYEQMTHLIWSFHHPQADGGIQSPHPQLDQDILPHLIQSAHEASTEVLIAIGGWGNSSDFSIISSSAQLRYRFARECQQLLESTGADGIDIDWEFPGLEEFGGTDQDASNLIQLMQDIREAIGPDKTLTIDIPSLPAWFEHFDLRSIESYVNFSSIMSYDMASPELSSTRSVWHNSALYDDELDDHWSLNRLTQHFLKKYPDLDRSKLNLGMAFYGRKYQEASDIGQSWLEADSSNHPCSALLYSEIKPLVLDPHSGWQEDWDPIAKVPFLRGSEGIISYDNERSISQKANYILQEGLGGVIIWELACDQIEGSHPLLNACSRILKASQQRELL